jgi:capsular exopolysaccharide synthesis family protein
MLDNRQGPIDGMETVVSALNTVSDPAVVRSEERLLNSHVVADRVVRQLGLADDPEFASTGGTSSGSVVSQLISWAGFAGGPVPATRHGERAVVEEYRKRLTIVNDGRSYALRIGFTAADPALAERIVNAHAQAYIDGQLRMKEEATVRATAWLDGQLSQVRTELADAERQLKDFRAANRLTFREGNSLAERSLLALSERLSGAEIQLTEKEAELREVTAAARRPGAVPNIDRVLFAPLIQRLREQESQLMRQSASLEQELGVRHPQRLSVEREIEDLRRTITQEIQKIGQSLDHEVSIARETVEQIRRKVASAENGVVEQDALALRHAELRHAVESRRGIADRYLVRAQEIAALSSFQVADARLASPAVALERPVYPRKGLWLLLAACGSAFAGTLLAMFLERRRGGFRSWQEAERDLVVPVLGVLPNAGRRRRIPALAGAGMSIHAECLFAIGNRLSRSLPASGSGAGRSILVSSCLPGEGKTTVSVSLGRALAATGRRTLVIDADLRRPAVAALCGGAARTLGTADVLSGRCALGDALRKDGAGDLSYLAAHPTASGDLPHRLLSEQNCRRLLDAAAAEFDIVIIDSPPLVAASDALALGRCADATMLVVQAETTAKNLVASTLKRFEEAGAALGGLVLNRVAFHRPAGFGTGDFEWHASRLRYYYDARLTHR